MDYEITIRSGIFETNSSSTHAFTVFPEDEFAEWSMDEDKFVLITEYGDPIKNMDKKIFGIEEVFNIIREELRKKEAGIKETYHLKIPVDSLEEFDDVVAKYNSQEIEINDMEEILSKDYNFYTFTKFHEMLEEEGYAMLEGIESEIIAGDEKFIAVGYGKRS